MKKKALALFASGGAVIYLMGLQPSSCSATGQGPIAVAPSIMVRIYRDNPAKAEELYGGRQVQLAMTDGTYRILDYPPVIVSDPPSPGKTRITVGVCRGRKDADYRGDNCYFFILIDCCEHRP